MIEFVGSYRFTCQGCGRKEHFIPDDFDDNPLTRDTRVWVRSKGWWCAETTQSIDGKVIWDIRCPTCFGECTRCGKENVPLAFPQVDKVGQSAGKNRSQCEACVHEMLHTGEKVCILSWLLGKP